MAEPTWVGTANPNAVLTRDEVLQWLKISRAELKHLCSTRGFPPPRYGATNPSAARMTNRSRWRVGDVRAWLASRETLDQELSTPTAMGDEAQENRHGRRTKDALWVINH